TWLAQQTMLINENRLSPLDRAHRAILETEMEKCLFGDGSAPPPGYQPSTAA
ncbi:MAG: Fe(2+)-trafficking protein, partial [Proteobacteria bacterium]|nr:Fe(2+)-trafficking protein [Pseudomonadota bacterium]